MVVTDTGKTHCSISQYHRPSEKCTGSSISKTLLVIYTGLSKKMDGI